MRALKMQQATKVRSHADSRRFPRECLRRIRTCKNTRDRIERENCDIVW